MKDDVLKTKMGKRLMALFQQIPEHSREVIDLCCDHGALGRAILETRPHCSVIFNDVRANIIDQLSQKLLSLNASNYQLSIEPAQNLKIQQAESTVVLAGVGAEQCIEILTELFQQPLAQSCHFIISPATKNFYVRQFLCQQGVYLLNEQTVTEKNRTYEIITVQLNAVQNSKKMQQTDDYLFGQCWQKNNAEHIAHLNKILTYYQAAKVINESTKKIITGYKKIKKNIEHPL
ncbi:tRNA (adenine(22)-N(1))-methyltransferase TrmK [Reinekea thalattae]|uniref:SAM-dependent methyltransferase n=1 Tax=Reinekea thalattae TaxID=2593301 RepID=A0A5C8ZBB4_9GAMM|nr:tRNA (adenine(22)-N(1))-methyltransferase TrmK [Reinekea thalattae]TXR54186.1 SAM-dependent methyltransferase [Reinekea thalattae]